MYSGISNNCTFWFVLHPYPSLFGATIVVKNIRIRTKLIRIASTNRFYHEKMNIFMIFSNSRPLLNLGLWDPTWGRGVQSGFHPRPGSGFLIGLKNGGGVCATRHPIPSFWGRAQFLHLLASSILRAFLVRACNLHQEGISSLKTSSVFVVTGWEPRRSVKINVNSAL